MNYRELALKILNEFTTEQQEMDVVISTNFDNIHPATFAFADEDNDVLDEDHPIIVPE